MGRFPHDDDREVAMPARPPVPKYANTEWLTCEVHWQQVALVTSHRTMLGDAAVADSRVFGLGIDEEDRKCHHVVVAGRFGDGTCTLCGGWLFCAAWVAVGLYGLPAAMDSDESDDTVEWANNTAATYADRMPRLALITTKEN